ncbi:copper chaperone PCu(A)C [Agrococcus sp. BE272]|uniref:copper chaperone PCu(A)C n=1 Tax=Agrococcus sp. BE272 TaxID=2817727 RepID=UPI00285AA7A0|nr:copper chaperone PCu(A)C [Agrococcus sp. BE272]MDR7233036.1 copper(I)-binding protein [Agrococcus sp. BE272]
MRASTTTFQTSLPATPVVPPRSARRGALALAAAVALLTGCAAQPGAPVEGATQADAVEVARGWIRATDGGMTGAFAELTADADARLVGASSTAASRAELHDTVDGGMTPVDAIDLPAAEPVELAPGGLHIMLLELRSTMEPGDEVAIELAFADGSTESVDFVVREAAAGDEDYAPSGDPSDHGSDEEHAGSDH